jgi:hypothetical protein
MHLLRASLLPHFSFDPEGCGASQGEDRTARRIEREDDPPARTRARRPLSTARVTPRLIFRMACNRSQKRLTGTELRRAAVALQTRFLFLLVGGRTACILVSKTTASRRTAASPTTDSRRFAATWRRRRVAAPPGVGAFDPPRRRRPGLRNYDEERLMRGAKTPARQERRRPAPNALLHPRWTPPIP